MKLGHPNMLYNLCEKGHTLYLIFLDESSNLNCDKNPESDDQNNLISGMP